LANVLSGVALICADLIGTDFPSGSYRVRHGHHRLPIRSIS